MRNPAVAQRTLSVYGEEASHRAIANYFHIATNPGKYRLFPEYGGFEGYIKSGVEQFGEDANPFVRKALESGDDVPRPENFPQLD